MRAFLRVGHRIAFGYLLLLFLVAAVGFWGFLSASRAVEQTRTVYEHPFTVTASLGDARRDILLMNQRLLFLLAYPGEMEHSGLGSEVARLEKDADAALNVAFDHYLGPQQDVQSLEIASGNWRILADSIAAPMIRGDLAAARDLYRVHGAAQLQAVLNAIDTMQAYARGRAEQVQGSSQSALGQQKYDLQRMLALALLLGGGAFLMVLRSIIVPLGRLRRSLAALSRGQLEILTEDTGRIDEIGDIARDLEDLRRALVVKQQTDLKFQTVFRNSPDLIAIVRKDDGRLIDVNDGFARQLGLSRDEAVGQSLAELQVWSDPQDNAAILKSLNRSHRLSELRTSLRRRDGNRLTVVMSIEQILLDQQECLIMLARDITRQKLEEETMHHMLDELARSNAELARFAQLASHDLQEPTRSICAYAQLLERRYLPQLDEEGVECLNYLIEGAQRMRDQINGLSTYSQAAAHAQSFHAVDMEQVVQAVLTDLGAAMRDGKAAIVRETPLPQVQGDARQLRQLMLALLSNALKFQPPGQAAEVRLRARRDGAHWQITVQDNGIGIPEAQRHAVFDMFRRLHGQSRYPGTGLGLALAKRIVENHHGRIWITAPAGGGTSLHLTLPPAEEGADLAALP